MDRVLRGLAVAALWVGGCSSSPDSECLAGGGAEVCLSIEGSVQVTGQGLEPGSDLTVEVADGPTQVVQVDETGRIGTVGFLTAIVPDEATVEVSGTARDGGPLSGTLSVG